MYLSSLNRLLAAAALGSCIPAAASAQQAETPPTEGTAYLNKQMAALAERHGADGWRVTPSGLRWRRIAGDGSGAHPGPADNVTVHYVGTFADGREFDSSVRRGEPTSFPLNRVIEGWQEGVALMGVGDKVELAIPWQLAYGPVGKGPIPGGATLLFTVELLGVEPAG
ncbi:peptidylprolyl isomerase [Sphingopyxis sp. Root214]|uniref:FKBP-type peptidyl-prolyl cis-trans isomerase n=1 Tax=unclassified Sphingopyxis TaxID=2614943 RepID=UPI0006F98729|nr:MULTISPECIES: FKBP-type peptidyl-prolyl cis-trans isomerase [unclassified Sphingopyxis]KQZ76743.1 peptidylprolyl isomerase [Sphingopyxis sp. Root154]KRC09370.1 peptidylprolyl isomerase [Sphingopyxis sp. Root214]